MRIKRGRLNAPELRYLLSKLEVSLDVIDDLMMRFLDEETIQCETFISKCKGFVTSFENLTKDIFRTPMDSVSESLQKKEESLVNSSDLKEVKEKFTFGDLLKTKAVKEGETALKRTLIRDHHYTEILVNFKFMS